MRTTLTLEDDVAAKLKEEMGRTGRSFKETVNEILREGLRAARTREPDRPFVVRARDLGSRAGVDFDNIAELIEQAEGPFHR
jgi:hypothetical protein